MRLGLGKYLAGAKINRKIVFKFWCENHVFRRRPVSCTNNLRPVSVRGSEDE